MTKAMAATRLKTTKDGRAYYEIRYRTSREASELSTRWYVPSGWSEKAIQRELAKQAAEFERQCRAGLVISHREKKEIAAQEAARQAAEAAKIVTAKQYGERVFMPGKLAGTIGEKALAENSRAYYQNVLDKHIYPIIGERKMQEVTRAELEALLLDELNSGKSESTISAVYVTLRQMFESAEDSELIRSNPMQKVKKPRRNKADTKDATQVEAFSIEEMQHILECLKNEPLKWQAYITLIIDTGCRRGEICGLRWQSVNFKDKTITIENNLVYTSAKKGGKGVFEDTPKTDASARVIDISDDAADLLRQLRIEQSRTCISPYVFSQDGRAEPMHPTSPTRYFKKFGERYGIDHFHPHKLRHTFASIAITNHADVASVSEKLGHANKGITLKMYTHANAESIKAAGDIFRNALKAKKDDSKQA